MTGANFKILHIKIVNKKKTVFLYVKPVALPFTAFLLHIIQGDTKKRELLKNPTKIEEIQGKKILTEIERLQLAF